MISRRAFALAVPAVATSVGKLRAAGVDGKWEAEIPNQQGSTTVVFDLKTEGEMLTGTIGDARAGEMAIQDGKVSGDEVSFAQVVRRGDLDIRLTYTGKLMGDELELTRTMRRPAGMQRQGGQGGGARRGARRGVTFTAKRVS